MVKVVVDQVSVFDLPVYKSRLVDETIYYNELCQQPLTNTERARAFILKSLRLRGVIAESDSDTEVSKHIKDDLVLELFDLLFYGPDGKPEELPLEEVTEKKKSTGVKSSGKSSSTTPASKSSAKRTLVAAQST